MTADYDIAIVGSGFAGSLMAMIARRLGRSVVLIDKGKHPRVVIGESSTPLTNLLFEELAIRYDLSALKTSRQMGNLATHLSRDSLWTQARLYLLSSRS